EAHGDAAACDCGHDYLDLVHLPCRWVPRVFDGSPTLPRFRAGVVYLHLPFPARQPAGEEVRLVDVFLCVLATSDDELKDEVVLLRYQEGRNDVRSAADQVVTDEINGLVRYSSDHDMLRFGAINVN